MGEEIFGGQLLCRRPGNRTWINDGRSPHADMIDVDHYKELWLLVLQGFGLLSHSIAELLYTTTII